MLNEITSKIVLKDEKVIAAGKRSKPLNEVDPI